MTRIAFILIPALAALAIAAGLWYAPIDWNIAPAEIGSGLLSRGFWTAAAVGLLAQIVDGALGMAYGVTSTTFLLSAGVPPAAASASVHIAEIFTTGFSGLAHWRLGNVDGRLFARLLIPGVVGAVLGAYLVTTIDGELLAPWISAYLLLLGLYIVSKAFRTIHVRTDPPTFVAPLAVAGGFVDAIGGGGWGPVVTTSLLGTGQDPRTTIGSVNAAEFFLAIASGFSFALLGGFTHWTTIAGLVFGGLFAAPLAALLGRQLPTRALLVIVGVLITSLSAWNLWKALT
ncbi:sulfite exporter TauE/SafE family protein [Labrys okinawensis]|uniref:sulfite exporter TauE/SafE family protein n=1 Tax=Labrys okinawensis TaxID=346911 RepID=UPI00269A07A8